MAQWLDRTNYSRPCPGLMPISSSRSAEADRMINSPIKAEELATEFSVVGKVIRDGRKLARAGAVAADDGRRLRVAQLRQVDDRQPI